MWSRPIEEEDDSNVDFVQLRANFLKTIEYDETIDYTEPVFPPQYVRNVYRFTMGSVCLLPLLLILTSLSVKLAYQWTGNQS